MPVPALPGLPRLPRQVIGRTLQAESFARRSSGQGLLDASREEEDEFKLLDIDDVLLAVPRGLEGLVRSVADLGNLVGAETNFSGGERLFGRSDTLGGGILEAVSQFAVPFGAAAKGLGFVGGLARARTIAVAGRAGAAAGRTFGASLARTVAAGAVADFTAFGAHEQRLSNVIEQFPTLAEVLPTFLAADENDTEIEGRLKNVVEGLGLGVLTDVLPALFKGLRAVRNGDVAMLGVDARGADFDSWFQGSKVTADDGKPLTVYHGTAGPDFAKVGDREGFNPEKYGATDAGWLSAGSYFTTDPKEAAAYAGRGKGARVLPVHVRLLNPWVEGADTSVDSVVRQRHRERYEQGERDVFQDRLRQGKKPVEADRFQRFRRHAVALRDVLIEMGFDGQIRRRGTGPLGAPEIVAFRNDQIRSALSQSFDQPLGVVAGGFGDLDGPLFDARKELDRTRPKEPIQIEREERARRLAKEAKKKYVKTLKVAGEDVTALDFTKTPRDKAEIVAAVNKRLEVTPEETALALSEAHRLLEATDGFTVSLLGGKVDEIPESIKVMLGLASAGRVDLKSLNLKHFALEADEVAVVRGLEQVISKITEGGARGPQTEPEMAARGFANLADVAMLEPEQQRELFDRLRESQVDIRDWMMSGAIIYKSAITDVDRFADEIDWDAGTGFERVNDAVSKLARYTEGIRGVREEVGRTMRSFQVTLSSDMLDVGGYIVDQARSGRLLTKLGTREAKKRIDQIAFFREFPDAERYGAMARFAAMDGLDRSIALTSELLTANLLSSPKTLTSNFMFPLMQAVYLPLEGMLGGALTFGFGKALGKASPEAAGLDLIRREADYFVGMFKSFSDAAHYGRRAAKEHKPILSSSAREIPRESLLRADTIELMRGKSLPGWLASGVNWLGKGITFSSSLMTGSDEFVRQMTARGDVYARLLAQGRSQGLSGPGLTLFAEDGLEKAFVNGQILTEETISLKATRKVLNRGFQEGTTGFRRELARQIRTDLDSADYRMLSPITEAALSRANEVAATTPLRDGSWGKTVDDAVARHPVFRIILPFRKTPVNLAISAINRVEGAAGGMFSGAEYLLRSNFGQKSVPIENLRMRNARDLASGDATKVAEAVGRLSAGMGFAAFAATAATAGVVTGGGPQDPQQRALLLSTGWQPYSIRVGDGWVQYLRADPLAAMIGIAADMADTAKFADPSESTFDTMSAGLMMAFAQNITNKTYMTGLRTFVDAVTKGERYSSSFVSRTLASLVVPRSVTSLTSLTDDPVLRDTASLMDEIKSRTPFLSSSVPPQRNVLGEPIRRSLAVGAEVATPATTWIDLFLPIAYREVHEDVINSEFRRLQHGFSPPSRSKNGVRVDEFKSDSGRDAYDRWGELQGRVKIGGRSLKQELRTLVTSATYRNLPDDPAMLGDRPQVRAIQQVISRFRERAWEQTLQEYPELDRATRSYFLLRRGRSSTEPSTNPFARFGR